MASTYSDLKIELIGTGEQTGTWGATTNTNLGTAIEEAITGSADVTFSSSDVTLTLTNTNGTQAARNLRLVCTGTSGGARNLILGSGCQINKIYLIQNDLADTVTVKNTTGTGVAVASGGKKFVFNDGTNVVEAIDIGLTSVDLTSDVTGILPLANGGTGASLTDPNADRILFWDDSAGTFTYLTVGTNLSITGTTLNGATQPSFDTGTRMMFAQTTAPTGWTKDTVNYNNYGLRVVTGTASSGGSLDFTTVFSSKPVTGNVSTTVTASATATTQGGNIVTTTANATVPVSIGNTTLAVPTIPSHSHDQRTANPSYTGFAMSTAGGGPIISTGITTGDTGGGGAHTHPGSGGAHSHPATSTFTGSPHTHTISAPATSNFSGTAINLAIKYLDVITATKN